MSLLTVVFSLSLSLYILLEYVCVSVCVCNSVCVCVYVCTVCPCHSCLSLCHNHNHFCWYLLVGIISCWFMSERGAEIRGEKRVVKVTVYFKFKYIVHVILQMAETFKFLLYICTCTCVHVHV